MVDGQELYLSESPIGEIKIEKMSGFTGTILLGGFFFDKEKFGEYHYFVEFEVTIVKGKVLEVSFYNLNKQLISEYENLSSTWKNDLNKKMARENSWWYRYLYTPWYIGVRMAGAFLCVCCQFFVNVIVRVAKFLTPI